jgi:3-oxoacyl-[acyl-carrier protein] reductase
MNFANRTAVITGACGDIGRALCRQFAEAGVRVAATDVRADAVEKAASAWLQEGLNIQGYVLDVTSRESVESAIQEIERDFGKIDILVNNAGVWEHQKSQGPHHLEAMPEEEWIRIIEINLYGTIRCMQAVLPGMVARRYGRVVNISSIAGLVGLPGYADYSAAKAAITMLTKTAAMENAKRGITVNCVSPGMITGAPVGPNDGTWLGRDGAPDEVARAVVFLAADASSYITGVDLPVDGGRVLGPHGATM